MKFIVTGAINFGSYKEITLDLESAGLSLIYGPTGSGKSTLPDIPAWVLFGKTAKDGNADEVRSWQTEKEEATEGFVTLETNAGVIAVSRIRGSQKQNDLYWTEEDSQEKIRGKDLVDTQKLLNERLGYDFNTYLSASYFSEFSPTASFFVANAKDRREVFEKITDLSLPVKLLDRISDEKKQTKETIKAAESSLATIEGNFSTLRSSYQEVYARHKRWDSDQLSNIAKLKDLSENHERAAAIRKEDLESKSKTWDSYHRQKLKEVNTKLEGFDSSKACVTCGYDPKGEFRESTLSAIISQKRQLEQQENPYKTQLQSLSEDDKNYQKERLQEERLKENPHQSMVLSMAQQLENKKKQKEQGRQDLQTVNIYYQDLELLSDLTQQLRALLLEKSVKEAEVKTNDYLAKFFDAEIQVTFSLQNPDKLKVDLQKNGYECSYKQLSKGQRQLLKLCFAVSIQKISSAQLKTTFDCLWFDEALDGLDSDFKVKAFSLFEHLAQEHSSVFLIEHAPEFQELFSNKYKVSISSDISEVIRES